MIRHRRVAWPEQARGKVRQAADIWALACVLFESWRAARVDGTRLSDWAIVRAEPPTGLRCLDKPPRLSRLLNGAWRRLPGTVRDVGDVRFELDAVLLPDSGRMPSLQFACTALARARRLPRRPW